MKIFAEWLNEHTGNTTKNEVAVEVTLSYTKKTPEVELLIAGINKLHREIFKKDNGYTTVSVDNEGKGKIVNEAYGTNHCGSTIQSWHTTL